MKLLSTDRGEAGVLAVGQHAVGIFAFGQDALGVVAVGQLARGAIAVGQCGVGLVAVGQGAVGLLYGGGMMGLAGVRGFGFVLALLPHRLPAEGPPTAPTTTLPALLSGTAGPPSGWVEATLDAFGGASFVGSSAQVDLLPIRERLSEAVGAGHDRAVVRCERVLEADGSGYRGDAIPVGVRAVEVVTYRWRPARWAYLRVGFPFVYGRGVGASSEASATQFVVRSVLWLIAFAVVVAVVFAPLFLALENAW